MKVSLWKSASNAGRTKTGESIRGKISGPIPIPNPIDDDFPMQSSNTGIAVTTPLGIVEPVEYSPSQQQQQAPPPTTAGESSTAVSGSASRPGVARSKTSDSVAVHSDKSPAHVSPAHSPHRRTNVASTVRYSAVSTSTARTGQSKDGGPQRKKSTLRNALGRLFGRRKKSESSASDAQRMSGLGTGTLHRSDPSALNRALTKDGEPKRSASLPITEYDRALRSHSIGPEDITAIESARNSLHADSAHRTRRRAATTTSQIYSPLRNNGAMGELAGLSPRPASSHGRSSRILLGSGAEGSEDPDEIGRAITSDIIGHRRRSRSLSGLQEAADERPGVRRRSDEIRYWRESYDPAFMSPISSNAPEGDDTGVIDVDVDLPPHSAVERPKTPPEPFSFGSIASMNEMAGMKITQAVSLDTRIGSLEARMRRLEKVVTQLCNTVPGFKFQAEVPEPGPVASGAIPSDPSFTFTGAASTSTAPLNPSIYQTVAQDLGSRYSSSQHSLDDGHSHMSFGDAPTYIGSLHPSTGLAVPLPAQGPTSAARPTSNSTVRGATSLPALPREITGPFTADHYTTLLALVETERSARQALEVQVRRLNHKLNIMSVSTAATAYQDHSQIIDPPPTSKSFGQMSAFDDDDDDDDESSSDENARAKLQKGTAPKKKVMQPEDSGIAAVGGDDGDVLEDEEAYSEDFTTPTEDRTFGAFGEVLREDDDPKRKKAARTLSLSQLTVSKSPPKHQHMSPPLPQQQVKP